MNTLYNQWNKIYNNRIFNEDNAIDNPIIPSTEPIDNSSCTEEIPNMTNISQDKFDQAKQWSIDSNITILYYTDDIDDLYNKFMNQPKDNRKKADWKAIELYGMDNLQLYEKLKNNKIICTNESIIINKEDIYYNKDKFDSGEINLCFITGHSGSGKSSMAKDLQNQEIEHYELDDLQYIKDHFTLNNLKEYGDLIYSYFTGPGKQFYLTSKEVVDNKMSGSDYEDKLYPDFVHYSMKYAKSHKDKKFILEGIWLFCTGENNKPWFNPNEFDNYAFYIKGTSMIISKHRACLRDAKSDNDTKSNIAKAYIKGMSKKWKWYKINEERINIFRKYFLSKYKSQNEYTIFTESNDFDTKLNKKQILSIMNKFSKKYGKDDYFISFKAGLVLYDAFDQCNDVDCYATKEFCDRLIDDGYECVKSPQTDTRKIIINDRLEIFEINKYDFHKGKKPKLNKVNGYYVEDIYSIRDIYVQMNREKDQETIKKLNAFLDKNESVIYSNNINSLNESFKRDNEVKWEYYYSPYFTPQEIRECGLVYIDSDIGDDYLSMINEYMDILKEYENYYNGYNNKFDILQWRDTVSKLQYYIEHTDDLKQQNLLKQELFTIGWNPEIPYNTNTQSKALDRLNSIYSRKYENVNILDVQSSYNSIGDYVIKESIVNAYPVNIVLVKGNSLFSDVIATATNGSYSHSAFALGNDFTKLYSFNAAASNLKGGGFSLESINMYPQENNIAIFTFFVNEKQWNLLNSNIQYMLNNMKNTSYSYINLLTLPFKNINLNMKHKLICSQYVDSLLKIADMNITNLPSDKVTPNILYKSSINNAFIYKIYEGPIKDFDKKKADKLTAKLMSNYTPFKECTTLKEFTNLYESAVLTEARKISVNINNDGDLLLSTPYNMMDMNRAYYNSHKLLLQYEKNNNYDGMKYELCKLYYMNYVLEKRIYGNSNKNRNEDIKTRARVLNDFNKYLDIVLKTDPTFNFYEYYESSPYSHDTVEINNSTLKGFKKIFNSIINP